MKTYLAALLAAGALTANAASKDQWKPLTASMADLVQNGYHLVFVTKSADRVSFTEHYFLQKDHTLARCAESHVFGPDGKVVSNVFVCRELVQPG